MIMKKFEVTITETLERTVMVKAFNKEEAIKRVKIQYDTENIILDASDYKATTFKAVKGDFENEVYNRTKKIA